MRIVLAALAIAALSALLGAAQAEYLTIVSDSFSDVGDAQVSLSGRTPETSLSGGDWEKTSRRAVFGQDWWTSSFNAGDPQPGIKGFGHGSEAVSIAGSGAYVKPTLLHVGCDLRTGPITGDASDGHGVGIGFWSNVDKTPESGNANSNNSFAGLLLDNTGNLSLVYDPNKSGFFDGPDAYLSPSVAYAGGAWSTNEFYNLSFDVDTTTGQISNVALEGSTTDYSSLSAGITYFTDAMTRYAGVIVTSEDNRPAYADNFLLTDVPEPSAPALLAGGLLGLLCYAWRRWKPCMSPGGC